MKPSDTIRPEHFSADRKIAWRQAEADALEIKAEAIEFAVAGLDTVLDAIPTERKSELLATTAVLRSVANEYRATAEGIREEPAQGSTVITLKTATE